MYKIQTVARSNRDRQAQNTHRLLSWVARAELQQSSTTSRVERTGCIWAKFKESDLKPPRFEFGGKHYLQCRNESSTFDRVSGDSLSQHDASEHKSSRCRLLESGSPEASITPRTIQGGNSPGYLFSASRSKEECAVTSILLPNRRHDHTTG